SSNITNAAAAISWTTDEASDSQVEYGLSTSYTNSTTLNISMVTSHSAGLSGLTGSTTYHYRVRSKDAALNQGASGDHTFTTSAAPDITAPVITGVGSSNITNAAAAISWTTDEASDSQVEYGTSLSYGNSTALNASMVTSHSAGLSGLAASTLYYYRVRSKDAALNTGTSGDYTFTTSAAPDNTAPVITGVGSSNINNAAATISWTTNEASNSQVEYGLSASYGNSTALNAAMVTSHSAGLAGLTGSTTYHYRVRSRDATLNLGTSGDYTFTTSATPDTTPPVFTSVGSSLITYYSASIDWTTNEASNSQVEYGLTTSYGALTALNADMVTSHSAALAGLAAGTLYHYRVRSRDAALNQGASGDYTFTTYTIPTNTPPTIGVDSPWSGATLSGTVGVTATAWDDAGVAKVDFIMGGTTYSDNAAPYSHQLNTLRSANGWRQLTVRAYDINSNTAETVLDLRVQNQDRTDTIVTSTGGAILSSIADIIVPPMSLAAPITITVVDEAMDDDALLDERRARASLQDITPIALGVRLLPDGYIPAGPISIKLPLNHSIKVAATMEEIIGLYSWNDTLNTWQLLTSTYSAADDSMNAQTAAFSVYRLFSRVPLVLTPAVGEVYVFPNPAKGEAKPVFHIETDSADKVEIRIHDFTGRQIHTKTITAGPALVNRNNKLTYAYEYEWEAGNAASGAYFYVVIVSKGGGKTLRKGKFAVIR
ncbi:MAG: fibronectin type III domain-containing protein, partial [Elusimicrobiota bacterium]|nr:fibronectin type III domain-containing protein [Elusimicrobiota bacterium]